MRIIHLARKPLEGTVAANILEHGAGGLHIDATRLGSGEDKGQWPVTEREGRAVYGHYDKNIATDTTKGRWPTNLVLEHLAGCRCVGSKRVKASLGGRSASYLGIMNDDGWTPKPMDKQTYADADGLETMDAWQCEPGCPVGELDGQSGFSKSSSRPRNNNSQKSVAFGVEVAHQSVGAPDDAGGASRYFKQVSGSHE